MATFWNRLNQEINELREQGHSVSSEVENFQKEFKEKADEAERLFREQERVEEEARKSRKSSN
ncbi:MAG: hypothetical protein HC833_20580 [Leptolyngbyaceae cyanobacterium RM1_406_9]|nr:hypothetical protein [Leptolyngbyaceae cyanobacterium RM1_406_9]